MENLGKAGQGVDAFLYACASRVVDADAGRTHLHGEVHDFAYLLRHGFGKGAAVHGEVLGKNIDKATIDGSATGYHAVAQVMFLFHAEVVAAVGDKHVDFLKTAFVKEHRDAFASRVFAFFVLFGDSFFSAAQSSLLAQGNQLFYFFKLITHIFFGIMFISRVFRTTRSVRCMSIWGGGRRC